MAEPTHIQTPEQLAGVLSQLVERRVSDIYVCAGRTIHVRTNGEVCPTSITAPAEEALVAFLNQAGETVIKGTRIETLRRFTEDVNEVRSGFECGIKIQDHSDDLQIGDVIEMLEKVRVR